MSDIEASQPMAVELSAVTIRCGCGNPALIHPGQPCPTPRTVEDMGVIGRWSSDDPEPPPGLFERLARRLKGA